MSDVQGPDDSWPRKNVPASRQDNQSSLGEVAPYSASPPPASDLGRPGSGWSPASWEEDEDRRPTVHVEVVRTQTGPLLPVPSPPKSPTVPVGRRTLTSLLIVLLVAVGAVAALVLKGPSTKTVVEPANNGLAPTTTVPVATATVAATMTLALPVDTGSSASPTETSSASPTETSTTSPAAGDSSQSPTDTGSTGPIPNDTPSFLGPPIDSSDSSDEDVQISGKDYSNSSVFHCDTRDGDGPFANWNSAGYSTFTGMIGVPDNAQSATGSIITVTFYDQNRKSLGQAVVSIGHPQPVTINLNGAVRMQMNCVSKDNPTYASPALAFGNGALNQ
jgi:hypothetical protein